MDFKSISPALVGTQRSVYLVRKIEPSGRWNRAVLIPAAAGVPSSARPAAAGVGLITLIVRKFHLPAPWKRTPQGTSEYSEPTELISGDGTFNETGLEEFINSVKLCECGVLYRVVAIMGPQSSGKSTLLNHLFHTQFTEMDASIGRKQTTKGIWIAKAPNIEPLTMVLDLEGTDGLERGQDDTTFEKQSALFALVIADILLINMWCNDIGRENAANRPLLKTIFEVMMRLNISRKTTLLFVIRDKAKSPILMERLEFKLKEDVQKIWQVVPKGQDFKDTPLSHFFNVEVTALSNFEDKEEQFKEEVGELRQIFSQLLSPGGLAGDRRRGVVPASAFNLSVKEMWETIKQNKDLDLPTHKKMVATVRCEEIADDKLRLFASNKDWLDVEQEVETRVVSGFSAKISSILNRYVLEYDSESEHFEEDVRNAKRQHLESKAFEVVYPAYINMLGHLRWEVLQKFETQLKELLSEGAGFAESVRTCGQSCELEFDKRCSDAAVEQAKWDSSIVRKELLRDIENHALHVRADKLPQVVEQCRERLSSKLTRHLNGLFKHRGDDVVNWASIRSLLNRETDSAASALCSATVAFELDQPDLQLKLTDLRLHATKLVENKFKEETDNVLHLMKERYILSLKENEEPFRKCLKLLSTMAVIRLDERDDDGVESLLFSELMGGDSGVQRSGDPLDSYTWEEVPPEVTLITPIGCKDIWVQFKMDIESKLKQTDDVEAKVSGSKQLPFKSDDYVDFEVCIFYLFALFKTCSTIRKVDLIVN
ncbi:Root hair defective 3 GTP-binding protein [Perilla frutescens var. frutescens]|nr:Root hair defective 3 GTP-binding protein [Perilla frutescens var. frutescens]